MKSPLDIKAVIQEALNIEEAQQTPVFATIFIDETSPLELQAAVRAAFTSDAPNARVSISYFPSMPITPFPGADLAVIVAGSNTAIGKIAFDIRAEGVPVMVVGMDSAALREQANAHGDVLYEEDIVAPSFEDQPKLVEDIVCACKEIEEGLTPKKQKFGFGLKKNAEEQSQDSEVIYEQNPVNVLQQAGPEFFTDEVRKSMEKRMGEWVLEACHDKRLACALAFPSVRKPLSLETVRTTALQNAAIGAVNFIPQADMPLMTLNQAKMALQIAAAYGQPLGYQRVKEIIGVTGGAFFFRGVTRKLHKVVPFRLPVDAGMGYAGTMAVGMGLVEYFEGNGTVDALVEKAFNVGKKGMRVKRVISAVDNSGKAYKCAAGIAAVHAGKAASKAAVNAATHAVPSVQDMTKNMMKGALKAQARR